MVHMVSLSIIEDITQMVHMVSLSIIEDITQMVHMVSLSIMEEIVFLRTSCAIFYVQVYVYMYLGSRTQINGCLALVTKT
jgi:hypothetical protein